MSKSRFAIYSRCSLALLVPALLCATLARAQGKDNRALCDSTGWTADSRGVWDPLVEMQGFRIETKLADGCETMVRSPSGEIVYEFDDAQTSLDGISGNDINGDGYPDLVLEGYSGGAHCCWNVAVVSLGPKPGAVLKFEPRGDPTFEKRSDGVVEVQTYDGQFVGFDDAPFPGSPDVRIYFRLDGKRVVDLSAEHVADYDKEIAERRKGIDAGELKQFLAMNPALYSRNGDRPEGDPKDFDDYWGVKREVAEIVSDYLYSGRVDQAWNALDEMWPAVDRSRIKGVIVDTYCHGLRADLGMPMTVGCTK